ncbi:MAG TPA: hypothetical protein VFU88_19365 [Ktedonobacterales bacterium]|nr:hypothetical protein [Ktedonobacterales bacterium]
MRIVAIILSLAGPALTFLLGAIATAFAILGSPFSINSPDGYRITALAVAPGVALSLVAAGFCLRSAARAHAGVWLAVQVSWLALIMAAAIAIALFLNSNDLPWFFPLIALPLMSLMYAIANPA